MHSVDSDPKAVEVFQSVSRLIVEGRIPGLAPRGFGEGPHCIQFFKNIGKIHTCLPDNRLCVRDRSLRRHLSLLWDNGVPLCIEILLCSDCPCGTDKALSDDISPLPDPHSILLEQWTISGQLKRTHDVLPSTNLGGGGNGRSLLQVIRSYLHFSQLAAWLSLSKGESPKNVLYRITMPGEAFASKFTTTHVDHEFPLAVVKDHIIKVSVKSMPRSEKIPRPYCSNPICPLNRTWKMSPVIESLGQALHNLNKAEHSTGKDEQSSSDFDELPETGILDGLKIIDERKPKSNCKVFGKHCCEDEFEQCGRKKKPTVSTCMGKHVSRRDLFIGGKSLGNRFKTSLFLEDERAISATRTSSSSSSSTEKGAIQNTKLDRCSPDPEKLSSWTWARREREQSPMTTDDESDFSSTSRSSSAASFRPIPTLHEKIKFRKSLHSAASMVFHGKTGLPLTSSPAPLRRGQNRFDFDSSLVSPAHLKSVIKKSHYPLRSSETSQLLGSFEESVLHGRIEPVSTVEGFTAEIGASGSFCPAHLDTPVTVFFYTFCDNDKVSTPYLAHINVGRKGYLVPEKGTIQVTLFNPLRTVIKMFVVMYDLSDMPPNSRTFLRQRILYMPIGASGNEAEAQKWLRYLIHLRFASSRSRKIYLHTDLRIIIFRKSDADTATGHTTTPYELRSFTYTPENPKYSLRMTSNSFRSNLFDKRDGKVKVESPLAMTFSQQQQQPLAVAVQV